MANKSVKQPVIMQVIPELGPGGAEQGCIDVAAELVAGGAKAIVVSHGGSRVHELNRIGAMHVDLPVHSKNPLTIVQNVTKLRELIKMYDVDIVHARSRAPAWSAYRACKNNRAHFMTTCHAPYNFKSATKKAYNSVMAKGDRVIAISGYVSDYLRNHFHLDDSTIRLVHRGIALEKFHPTAVTPERLIALSKEWRIPDGANVVMLPGRLTRWKGHHVLIEALARLARKDVFGVIIGSDQGRTKYRKELEEYIAQHDMGAQIRMVDHCSDMPAAYMLSTVVVSASTDPEGFGRVPVEAQAMGRPIVATDHGGAKETVRRGETGWLVPPENSLSMAEAIQEALALTPSQRSILATRAMAHIAENFTREIMVDKTLNVYAELLQGQSLQSPHHSELRIQQQDAAQ